MSKGTLDVGMLEQWQATSQAWANRLGEFLSGLKECPGQVVRYDAEKSWDRAKADMDRLIKAVGYAITTTRVSDLSMPLKGPEKKPTKKPAAPKKKRTS